MSSIYHRTNTGTDNHSSSCSQHYLATQLFHISTKNLLLPGLSPCYSLVLVVFSVVFILCLLWFHLVFMLFGFSGTYLLPVFGSSLLCVHETLCVGRENTCSIYAFPCYCRLLYYKSHVFAHVIYSLFIFGNRCLLPIAASFTYVSSFPSLR